MVRSQGAALAGYCQDPNGSAKYLHWREDLLTGSSVKNVRNEPAWMIPCLDAKSRVQHRCGIWLEHASWDGSHGGRRPQRRVHGEDRRGRPRVGNEGYRASWKRIDRLVQWWGGDGTNGTDGDVGNGYSKSQSRSRHVDHRDR